MFEGAGQNKRSEEGKAMDTQIERLLHGVRYKQLLESRIMCIREKYDLRKVDIEVLYYLSKCGDRNTPTDIKDGSMLTKSHISQSVDMLQKRNLLELIPDSNDRRCVHLALTEQARAVVEDINKVWADLNRIVLDGVTEEEKQIFRRVSAKISDNMDQALQELRQ